MRRRCAPRPRLFPFRVRPGHGGCSPSSPRPRSAGGPTDGGGDEEAPDETESEHPYEAASARLRRLERRHPSGDEAAKAFYVDLTEALRVYLVRRVGVRALEQTTAEVVAALRRRPEVRDATIRRLQAVLEQADLVKFADAQPSPAESRSVLEEAQAVLDALEAIRRREDAQTRDDAQATDDTPPSA